MKNSKIKEKIIIGTSFCLLWMSCTKDVYDPSSNTNPETPTDLVFDFSTERSYTLNVKYDVPEGYKVFFEVYTELPVIYDEMGQESKKEGLEPIDKGYTNDLGIYSYKIQVPAVTKELYIYTTDFGVPRLMKATIENNILSDPQIYDSEVDTKAGMLLRSAGTIDQELQYMKLLGTWVNNEEVSFASGTYWVYGHPAYVLTEELPLSKDIFKWISQVLPEKDNSKYTQSGDIKVTENAELKLYFLNSDTKAKNIFGYYIYDTENPPTTLKDIENSTVVAFPNAKIIVKGENKTTYKGGLMQGEAIQLRYFKDGKDQGTTFPAGVSIGFILYNEGYKPADGSLKPGNGAIFSTSTMPSKVKSGGKNSNGGHLISLRWDDFVILGFEDWNTNDFNDLVFHVESSPSSAITDDIPEVKPEPENPDKTYTITKKGTLSFEDLWPRQGDFDMNDVVIRYDSEITYNEDNMLEKTKDTYTFLWSGASIHNGFGYQINASRTDVEVEGATVDPNISKATLRLFDDALALTPGDQFVVTTTYKRKYDKNDFSLPPYNPFITPSSDHKKEVHLTNYPPTAAANLSLFGTNDDRSDANKNLWYITFVDNVQMPFAIHMPDVVDFVWSKENKRIEVYFPQFMEWVTSMGEKNKDWYLHPVDE
ncbi:LruC domain-containing protein [Parabacteroides bouchesdurhonensis]|uniref:LruC domain-containing protein n=1 Tax=Parabacteroides bouchesdurhonensis TaxID=1936995 RepID=UPI000E546B66|nr:LruC domain-containing protein [Parabacteroides bouchesdurhonensis]RHJ91694.1 LruC domain-containing protein [Bacteroides sp. AM07-16]